MKYDNVSLWIRTETRWTYIDGLVQERRNSIANALELRLSCTNQSIYGYYNISLWYVGGG